MHAIDMTRVNAFADFAARMTSKPQAQPVKRTSITTYAYFLDTMLATRKHARIAANPVRAARLGAYRRKAKPYTLGQIRAHVKYRANHQREIYATFTREARAL